VRTALSRVTKLAGIRKAEQIGGKTGVTAAPSTCKKPRQRRARPGQGAVITDSGRAGAGLSHTARSEAVPGSDIHRTALPWPCPAQRC